MQKLELNALGRFGDLVRLQNPDNLVFRSEHRFVDILINGTAVKGEVLTEAEYETALNDFWVIACHPNEIDISRLPYVFDAISYEDYLKTLEKGDS